MCVYGDRERERELYVIDSRKFIKLYFATGGRNFILTLREREP